MKEDNIFIKIFLMMIFFAICTFTVIIVDGIADLKEDIKIECKK